MDKTFSRNSHLHIWTHYQSVDDENCNTEIPKEAKVALAVYQIPFDLSSFLLCFVLWVLIIIYFIYNLINQEFVKLPLLS